MSRTAQYILLVDELRGHAPFTLFQVPDGQSVDTTGFVNLDSSGSWQQPLPASDGTFTVTASKP